MRLFCSKKVVDEREEMEMFKVEHYMCWFAFWALLAGIFVQIMFMKASFRQIAGEWTVFMLLAAGIMIGELKGGHFDYNSRPGWKSYLLYSLAAALAVLLLTAANGFLQGYYKNMEDAFLSAGIVTVNTFILTYAALAAAGAFVRRRRRKLEKEYDEEP